MQDVSSRDNNINKRNNNNINGDTEMKNSGFNSTNNEGILASSTGEKSSKSLEIIKQKKMNRMSMIDVNSNLSKKLASDNMDYDPVFK